MGKPGPWRGRIWRYLPHSYRPKEKRLNKYYFYLRNKTGSVIEQNHLSILKKGVKNWNFWREQNPNVKPFLLNADLRGLSLTGINFKTTQLSHARLAELDLSDANFEGASLDRASMHHADLSNANFSGAILNNADLVRTNLQRANFSDAILNRTDFYDADLTDANFKNAWLFDANLTAANLTRANLTDTKLQLTRLIETNLSGAILKNCWIYGISVWNVNLNGATQQDLNIAANMEDPIITLDNIEMAQFIFLILNNKKIREVIDTITSKMVLILGRFTDERKIVLDEIRVRLRELNYVPVLFDFEKPTNRDIVETISTLAHMSRFVIADITDAAMIREELDIITRSLPHVPIQPIILSSEKPYSSFEHIQNYPWVLKLFHYDNLEDVRKSFTEKIVNPPELLLMKGIK
jgi:uncharacterized protein YjbI with pentapeptide repeats